MTDSTPTPVVLPGKRPKAEVARALAPHLAALHAKYGTVKAGTERVAS